MLVVSGESDVKLLQFAYHDLAMSIFMQKDFDEALRVVDEAGTIAPGFSRMEILREQILASKAAASEAGQQ